MKRLIFDIETSPNIGLFWRAGWKQDISHDSIIQERRIITIAWKWHGARKIYSSNWDARQNDEAMLREFILILNSADESVAHFGDSFDLPWIKTRCLFHRIPTLPKYKTIDTKAWASKHFLFNSNKLDYLSKFLGRKGKLKTDYDLWKKVLLNNDRKALSYMVKYNMGDVEELEYVYDQFAAVVPHKTHVGVVEGRAQWTCPHCASANVQGRGLGVTAAGVISHRMQCNTCHRYYQISDKVYGERQPNGRSLRAGLRK